MELHQKAAIIQNQVELIEVLRPTAVLFLSYLECNGIISFDERQFIERSCLISSDQLQRLLGSLQHNEKGWSALITYLRRDNKNSFADVLEKTANEQLTSSGSGTNPEKIPKQSALELFSVRLANYYQLNYANLLTMGESPKRVKDVWVPLQIDGRSEGHLPSDRIKHDELLNRLKSTEARNVGLVKGDPGMGKTTLAKKIAFEWAIKYGSNEAPQFSLVLAVPLRSAGKSNLFSQLAVDYFCSMDAGQFVKDINLSELTEEINSLGPQLLVILDGLDEYANYSESPFKVVFARPFQLSSANSREPPPMISFKLIVTSRPYACERINEEFWPLRFVLLPLDAEHLSNFVRLYCQTPTGIEKVTDYLTDNADLVIKVPLILTFVCYLADLQQKIPTNMTSLYDELIRQMVKREIRQEKLVKSVNILQWKEANVVSTTAELAYVQINQLEFSSHSLELSHVTSDSFICGFLLHKFDFATDVLKAEFPHRSIQEFFAALHCHQLMLSGCKDELNRVKHLIMEKDSLVGRFFFGICSKEERFDKMTKWLSLTRLTTQMYSGNDWDQRAEITATFGTVLRDCSSEENCVVSRTLFE